MRKITPRLLILAVPSLLAVSVWLLAAAVDDGADLQVGPAEVRLERGGLVYMYHPVTDTEALFDVRKDPRCLENIMGSRPLEAHRLRRELCDRLGISAPVELRDPSGSVLSNLRTLGYL